jgi:hypothetical protein
VDSTTFRQLQGASDLAHDAVDAAVTSIGEAHRQMSRLPFDLVEQVDCLAGSARLVRTVHDSVLDTVYGAVQATTRGSGALLSMAIALASRIHGDDRRPSRTPESSLTQTPALRSKIRP